MTVTSVTSAIGAGAGGTAVRSLGQAEFIKLLTTQMKMQDPTDPVDNKEMIAQMAQFSSLAGIDGINQTLRGIADQLAQVIAAQTVAQPQQTAA